MAILINTLCDQYPYIFSICSLVTDFTQHEAMRKSFADKGFTAGSCEFLCLDNSVANQGDAYEAVNHFLRLARGRYVILCHQDVRLHDDDCDVLRARIAEVEGRDPHWGVLGNAGGSSFSEYALRISDPHGTDSRRGGPFPAAVMSLDENFLVVRAAANLAVSRDIGGFHLYGTDLCLIAAILGYSAYVIDFHLQHLSGGNIGNKADTDFSSFAASRRRFLAKYQRALAPRWLNTTCTRMYLSGNRLQSVLGNLRPILHLKRRLDRLIRFRGKKSSP